MNTDGHRLLFRNLPYYLTFLIILIVITCGWFNEGLPSNDSNSSNEIPGFIERLWVYKNYLITEHSIPNWNPYNFCGHSTVLWNSQLLPVLICLPLSLILDLITTVKILILLSLFLAFLGTFHLISSIFKDKRTAFLCGLFYSFAPILLLHSFFYGHAGLILFYGLLPFSYHSTIRFVRESSIRNTIVASIWASLLIYSNNLSAFISLFFFIIYFLISLSVKKTDKLTLIKHIIIFTMFTFGISSFFLLPALLEMKYNAIRIYEPVEKFRTIYSLKNILFLLNRNNILFNKTKELFSYVYMFESDLKYLGILPVFMTLLSIIKVRQYLAGKKRIFFLFSLFSFLISI